jgi:hypothetical protein
MTSHHDDGTPCVRDNDDLARSKARRKDAAWRPRFQSLFIDEAHKIRNPFSFWFFGAALLAQDAGWVVAATGTPYNNREQVVA